MEVRIARLESDVDYIKRDIADIKSDTREIRNHRRTDFRLVFAAIITATLGLAGVMAAGFGWIH